MKKLMNSFILFYIINLFSGCDTTKWLSINEASVFKDDKRDFLIVYVQDKQFLMNNYKFQDGYLEGDLYISKSRYFNGVTVFTDLDLSMFYRDSFPKFFRIPYETIIKINYVKTDALKTIGFLVCLPLAVWSVYWGGRVLLILITYSL